MAEAPTTEYWKDIKPIANAFRPGAKPDAYFAKIAEGDERLWVPFNDTGRTSSSNGRRENSGTATVT